MDNTLQARIMADFSPAIDSANKFSDEVLDIAESMERISKSTKNLNLKVAEQIKKEVASLKESQESLDVDLSKIIKDKMSNILTQALTDRRIILKDKLDPLELELNSAQINRLNRSINQALVASIVAGTGDEKSGGLKLPAFRIPKTIGAEISQALNRFILKNVGTPRFTWENDTEEMKKIRKPMQLSISDTHTKAFISAIENRFAEMMSGEGMINLRGLRPINVDVSKKLSVITEQVSTMLKQMESEISTPLKDIMKLPKLAQSFTKFKTDLKKFVTDVQSISKELEGIGFASNSKELADVKVVLEKLKINLTKTILHSVNELNNEVINAKLGSINSATIIAFIENINKNINKSIIAKLQNLDELIKNVPTGVEVTSSDVGKELSTKITSFIRSALKDITFKTSKADVNLDSAVKEASKKVESAVRLAIRNIAPVVLSSVGGASKFDESSIRSRLKQALPEWSDQINMFEQQSKPISHIGKLFKDSIRDRQQSMESVMKAAQGDITKQMNEIIPTWSQNDTVGNYIDSLQGEIKYFTDMLKKAQTVLKDYKPDKKDLPVDGLIKEMNEFMQKTSENIVNNIKKEIKSQVANMVKEATGKPTISEIEPMQLEKFMGPVKKSLDSFGKKYIKAYISSIAKTYAEQVKTYKPDKVAVSSDQKTQINTQMQKNIESILKHFHRSLLNVSKASVGDYKNAMNKVQIKPDITVVNYLTGQMMRMQGEIVRKIREVLSMQFKAMSAEIKAMNLMPTSIGYNVPAYARQSINSSQRTIDGLQAKNASIRAQGSFISQTGNSFNNMPFQAAGFGAVQRGAGSGGDTRSFMGSVVNTMRYMSAGMMMGGPMMAMRQSWAGAKEFDYQLEKARLNLLAKDQTMMIDAERRVKERYERASELGAYGVSYADYNNMSVRESLIKEEANNLKDMTRDGIIKPLQDIAIQYAITQADIGRGWQIATRRLSDPYEALALARSSARIYGYEREEISMEDASRGLEAMASQWGLTGYDMDRVSAMALKTAMISQATTKDILEAQSRSGAIFRQVTPHETDEEKMEAIARSMVYQSLFVQATARSGKDGGTFWRSVLMSPYRKNVSEYLNQMADVPGYEALRPFKQESLESGDKLTYQKSGLELFEDIIKASESLRAGGREQERMSLLIEVFKRFQVGNQQAVQALILDMDKAADEAKEKGFSGIEAMVEQLVSTDSAEIEVMISQLSDNLKFREQKLKTMWEVSSFAVIDELKPEFSNILDGLTSSLRVIRNNADTFADTLKFLVKAMMAYGVKRIGEKSWAKFSSFVLEEEYAAKAKPLIQQYSDIERRNALLGQSVAKEKEIQDKITKKRPDVVEKAVSTRAGAEAIQTKINQQESVIDALRNIGGKDLSGEVFSKKVELLRARQDFKDARRNMRTAPDEVSRIGFEEDARRARMVFSDRKLEYRALSMAAKPGVSVDDVIAKTQANIIRLKGSKSSQVRKAELYEGQLSMLDRGHEESVNRLGKHNEEMQKLGTQAQALKDHIGTVGTAFSQLGVSGDKINARLNKLSTGFIGGKLTGKQFEFGLKQVALNAEYSNGRVGTLDVSVSKLNQEFLTGAISANQYIAALNKLQGVRTPVAGPGKGILTREGLRGISGKLGGVAKSAGTVGLIMAILDVITSPLTAASMTPGELIAQNIGKQEKFISTYMNIRGTSQSVGGVVKGVLSSMVLTFKGITEGIGSLLGGTGTSFTDQGRIIIGGAMGKNRYEIMEMLDVEARMAEAARLKIEEEKRERELYDSIYLSLGGGGRADSNKMDWADVYTPEEGQAMVARVNRMIGYRTSTLDSEYSISKIGLLLKGYREESDEVRSITEEMLEGIIESFKWGVDEIRANMQNIEDAQPFTYTDNEAWKEANKELEAKQKLVAEHELKLKEVSMSRLDNITNTLSRNLAMMDAESSIALSDAILSGYSEESQYFKDIQNKALTSRNVEIADSIKSLKSELASLEGKDREDLLLQIRNLQAESKDNLVQIKRNTGSGASFNIPAGVKPITYFEALARGNSERVVAVQQGNVHVSMVIDKVYAGSEDEVIKKIAQPVIDSVKDSLKSRDVSNDLVRQASRGVNYRPT